MSNPSIPETWRVVTGSLAEAQSAREVMKDGQSPQPLRDEATARYVRAADALVSELGALRKNGALAAIADFLKGRYGQP